jgi:hypothetical protein
MVDCGPYTTHDWDGQAFGERGAGWYESQRQVVAQNVARTQRERLDRAAECWCVPCRIACLTEADRVWLAAYGWRPELLNVCERQVQALIATEWR